MVYRTPNYVVLDMQADELELMTDELFDRDRLIHISDSTSLDERAFIYLLWNKGEVIYVGQTRRSVSSRLAVHRKQKIFDEYSWMEVEPCMVDDFEMYLINKLQPTLNVTWKDQDIIA